MAQLSSEERIKRIEQAPREVQTMVAKAYLRDDIDDEDVQYLFNVETPEEMNDPDDSAEVENMNADDPEGIGAVGYIMRTTRPANDKNYIVTGSGGWNTCIKGNPTYSLANALANCVGYASGRFNEIINLAKDIVGCTYKRLNCNASGFVDRAKAAGLTVSLVPKRGAIMCWGGGTQGAGHVAIVERVDSNSQVYTSESGWGSSAIFWNQIRTNKNGRWGLNSNYFFKGFIYLPDDVQKIIDDIQPEPTPTPTPTEEFKVGDKVTISGNLYTTAYASQPAGSVSSRNTEIALVQTGAPHPYNTTGYLGWMDASSVKKIENPTPTPQPTPAPAQDTLKVGDKVEIIGTGNGSCYGGCNTAYGIGWKRQVLKIWSGKAYPYQVGNNTATTGFYKADALRKL